MNNGPDSLAGNIVPALIFIFLGGIVVFTLIYMVYYVWTVPRQSSTRLHQIVKNGKSAVIATELCPGNSDTAFKSIFAASKIVGTL